MPAPVRLLPDSRLNTLTERSVSRLACSTHSHEGVADLGVSLNDPTGAGRMGWLDPRSMLSWAGCYRVFRFLVGGTKYEQAFLKKYVGARRGDRLVDLGCGAGDTLAALPAGIEYVGIDASETYIHAARRRFGQRGQFLQFAFSDEGSGRLSFPAVEARPPFDVATALGVLHHLDDAQATCLLGWARRLLKPGGRLVTYDGCYTPAQTRWSRFLLRLDRGKFVRSVDEYVALAANVFGRVRAEVRQDLLRIPYTHLVMQCE